MKTLFSIIVYLALTFAGSAIFYAQGLSGASVEEIALPLMWMPGLAALITQLVF